MYAINHPSPAVNHLDLPVRRMTHDALYRAIEDVCGNCAALKDEGHSRHHHQQHWIGLIWLCLDMRATGQRQYRAKIH